MGRKRSSEESESSSQGCGNSEAHSVNSSYENSSRKRLKRKYKKSHNYKLIETEISEDEIEYLERKKHKHKHKKHKRDSSKHRSEQKEESDISKHHRKRHSHRTGMHEMRSKHRKHADDSEKRSTHRKRERHRHNDDASSQDMEYEDIHSKWNDDKDEAGSIQDHIKTEPISEDEDTLMEEPRAMNNTDNHNNNKREVKKERMGEKEKWGKDIPEKVKEEKLEPQEKGKVNLGLSGKLAEDTNTYKGIVIKYSQPPEARKPKRRWRWYIFKGDEELPFLPLHRQSAYLIGRERKVADIPTDHPSCSKQHAVFQYRLVSYQRPNGTTGRTVKPYILDLESANGTYVNNKRIEPKRYVELFEKDVVKFGYSSREYVLLHEASKGSDDDLPDVGVEMDMSPVSLLRSH